MIKKWWGKFLVKVLGLNASELIDFEEFRK